MASFLDELRTLYARVDALYAEWSCPNSGDCCRFGPSARQPYVTAIEWSAIRHAVAADGGGRHRYLPMAERTCPLLDRDGRCSVYADRPFGCRTFYCGRAHAGTHPDSDELSALVEALRELAARHELGGEIARPLALMFERGA
ncbi:MAG TPA: YkgJ family cysteine cluster protein [Polyangiales bacterium]|nr:YkgJ family cysteine cluster protein [Polyangiales bacterium]